MNRVEKLIRALDIDHLPSADLLASAATLLDLGDLSAVRADLRLPRSGAYASAISWQSSNPAVLSSRGKVTRPGLTEPDALVTLTATLTLDGQLTTRSFAVRVKSLAPPVPVAAWRFEDNLNEASGSRAPGVDLASFFVPSPVHPLAPDRLVAWLAGQALGLEGTALLAVTVLAALPTAQNLFVHANRYGRGVVLARDAIFATTVLALPAMFVITALLA